MFNTIKSSIYNLIPATDKIFNNFAFTSHSQDQNNKNNVAFDLFLHEQNNCRQKLIDDLPLYIDRNYLELFYQPQIDIRNGEPKSLEALIRWTHHLAGPISPDIFIPLAEKSGYIHKLTLWVLDNALEYLSILRKNDIKIKMSVNISIYNVLDNNFIPDVNDLIEKWSIPAEQLILEVRESSMLDNPEHVLAMFKKMHQSGIKISLDDFGMGYSSSRHLNLLPIDEIKIDRSLIRNMVGNRKNKKNVGSFIELAKTLGVSVVAEGVEDADDCHALRKLSCDRMQGYYISKPAPVDVIMVWLENSGVKKISSLPRTIVDDLQDRLSIQSLG